jgi:WD40-like Beta Propeller Repeat
MGPDINTAQWEMGPALSADGKYLFFTRRKAFYPGEPSKVFWVDASIIDKLRK